MEIQSAFNSGVQGLQRATEAVDQAAADIAAETSASYEADAANQAPASSSQTIPDLNQSIVDLKVADYQAKASTEVIKTADDNLGTLLDVTA
ncbi:MAG: hypothetical protein JKY81_12965 [Colwellia sp.]|nr:hypothetical protein [Colwellia sp.]